MTACAPPASTAPTVTPDQQTYAVGHLLDMFPKAGDVFALTPNLVVVNFDFPLTDASAIVVTRNDQPVQVGSVVFGANKIAMSVSLPKDAGDGLYRVKFTGCFNDRTCADDQYTFRVNAQTNASYLDQTGKPEVTIRMKDIKFGPSLIRVSKGTHVTWINDDPIAHFVNSDPHPSHNAYPRLNSLEIAPGSNYSFTFDQPGEWAYHCSAHFPANMFAHVIVQDR